MSSASPATPWTSAVAASNKASTATAAAPATRSTPPAHPDTGADLLTDKQRQRLTALFPTGEHAEVEATWGVYQRLIAAYRDPDRSHGHEAMTKLIDALSHGVPAELSEVIALGRTLKKRATDAYFNRPGTGNGPTEAIN